VPAPASPGPPPPPAGPPAEAPPAAPTAPAGRVALVVGTTTGGTGAHVRMLAAGFAGRGIDVSVLGPSSADALFGFGRVTGVTFSPVEFSDRPRLGDVAAVLRLRRLLGRAATPTERRRLPPDGTADDKSAGPDVVHAHGLRAGALTVIALAGRRRRAPGGQRPRLVVTVHNAPPVGGGARGAVYRLLEHVVAHGADLVLCVSPDLEARMRAAGMRRVGPAIVAAADPAPKPASSQASLSSGQADPARPVVLAVGRLAAQKDFGTLLEAAARWRDLAPLPLLKIAGDGPLAGELRARAASLGVDAEFLGHRDDVADLLAAATVFVLPSRWEGQPLVLQEALRAGAAIVATGVGGIPNLVGDDAAVLVQSADAQALADAVHAILRRPPLAARLRAAAAARGAALPTAADAVAAALAAYARIGNVA
jgi:glycosyltransferase involved in cell wall biosynthesis